MKTPKPGELYQYCYHSMYAHMTAMWFILNITKTYVSYYAIITDSSWIENPLHEFHKANLSWFLGARCRSQGMHTLKRINIAS